MQYRATPAGSRDSPLALVLNVLQTTSRRSDPTPEPQIARNGIRTTSERNDPRPEPLIARTVIRTTGARGDHSGASHAVMEKDAQRPNNHEARKAHSARPSGIQTAFTRGQGPDIPS